MRAEAIVEYVHLGRKGQSRREIFQRLFVAALQAIRRHVVAGPRGFAARHGLPKARDWQDR